MGIEQGHVRRGDHVALLGIGSGINVVMLGVEWQRSLVLRSHRPLDQLAVEVVDRHAGVDHDPLGVDAAGAGA